MLTKVIISPFAEPTAKADAEREIAAAGLVFPVELSEMTRNATLIPTAEELRRLGML